MNRLKGFLLWRLSVTLLTLLTGVQAFGTVNNSSVQNNNLFWHSITENYHNKKPSHLLGTIKAFQTKATGDDLCKLLNLEALIYIENCPIAVANEKISQIKLCAESREHSELSQLIAYSSNPKSQTYKNKSKTTFLENLKRSREWKLKIISPQIASLAQTTWDYRCHNPSNASETKFSAIETQSLSSDSIFHELRIFDPKNSEDHEQLCAESKNISSKQKIENLNQTLGLKYPQHNDVAFDVHLIWGDCHLKAKKLTEAKNEYFQALNLAQTQDRTYFIEHRLNWVALNENSAASKSRSTRVQKILESISPQSSLRSVLIFDLAELIITAQQSFDILNSFLTTTQDLTETQRLLKKILRQSRIDKSVQKRITIWAQQNSTIREQFHSLITAEYSTMNSNTSLNAKASCETLDLLGQTAFTKVENNENLIRDFIQCSEIRKNQKDFFHSQAQKILTTINISDRAKVFNRFLEHHAQNQASSEHICQLTKANLNLLLDPTADKQLSIESCLNALGSPQAQSKARFVLDSLAGFLNQQLLNRLTETQPKQNPVPTWLMGLVTYMVRVSEFQSTERQETLFVLTTSNLGHELETYKAEALKLLLDKPGFLASEHFLSTLSPEAKLLANLLKSQNRLEHLLTHMDAKKFFNPETLTHLESARGLTEIENTQTLCFQKSGVESIVSCAQKNLLDYARVQKNLILGTEETGLVIRGLAFEKYQNSLKASVTKTKTAISKMALAKDITPQEKTFLLRQFSQFERKLSIPQLRVQL
jgi:hypothetical protein